MPPTETCRGKGPAERVLWLHSWVEWTLFLVPRARTEFTLTGVGSLFLCEAFVVYASGLQFSLVCARRTELLRAF